MSSQGAAQWGAQGASLGTSIMPGWGTLIGGAAGLLYGSTLGGNQRPEFTMIHKGAGELMAQRAVKAGWQDLAGRYTGAPVRVLQRSSETPTDYSTSDAYNVAGGAPSRFSAPAARLAAQRQDTNAQGVNTTTGSKLHSWAMAGKMKQNQDTRDTINSVNNMRLAYQLQSKALLDQERAQTMAAWAQFAGSVGYGVGARPVPKSEAGVEGLQDGQVLGTMTPQDNQWVGADPGYYNDSNGYQWG